MVWFVSFAASFIFLLFQAQGIYTGDSGDLVTAAVSFGVPHPPGYPLYTFLGYIFSFLPFITSSWRVTLLSSLAHAFTISIVFLLVYRLTKSTLSSVFACVMLLGNYLFFLYSVTPEVFALLDFFVMLLLYELILYRNKPSIGKLSIMALTFGLSLTHHHVILFVIPAVAFYIGNVGLPRLGLKEMGKIIGAFGIGLLPYIYAPIAGATNAIINWDKPVTWARFIQLVTRQDYGSFVSGGLIGHTFSERFISIKAYFSFAYLDFTLIGVIVLLAGLWGLWKKDRLLTQTLLILLFILGPFFFFYASFPIVSRFTLGTFERFLLPSYCIYAVLLGVGFHTLSQLGRRLLVLFHKKNISYVTVLFSLILFLYPLTIASMTLYRFMGLTNDRTAENLGNDVLSSLPEDAIVFLSSDTTLFTTQFVRYGLGVRKDTAVLHASRMAFNDYREVVKANFPYLLFPSDNASKTYVSDFISLNNKKHRVFSNSTMSLVSGWYFIPHGLLYEIVASDNLPDVNKLQKVNTMLFDSYRDPRQGILSRYKHLMLSDVLDVYAWAHINYGKALVKATLYEPAISQFEKAIQLGGESSKTEGYLYLGASYSVSGRCTDALSALGNAKASSKDSNNYDYLLYEAITYKDCVNDATKAASLFSEYEQMKSSTDTSLESL